MLRGGRRESCGGFVLPKGGWEPKDEKREELGQNSSQKNVMLGGICALGSPCIPVAAGRAVGKHSMHGGAGKLEWPLPTRQGFVVWGGWARMLWPFLQTSRQRWAGGRHQQHPRSPPLSRGVLIPSERSGCEGTAVSQGGPRLRDAALPPRVVPFGVCLEGPKPPAKVTHRWLSCCCIPGTRSRVPRCL